MGLGRMLGISEAFLGHFEDAMRYGAHGFG